MKKIKVNANLLAVLMLLSLFAGWEYMILVTAFIWCFCESSQNLKNLTIRAIAVYGGCWLFSTLWNVISGGYGLGVDLLEDLFSILTSYGADVSEASLNLNKYVLGPLGTIVGLLGSAVSFLILLVKFKFVVSVVTNRPMSGVFGKIQEYINYFVNFANSNLYEDPQQNKQ